MNQTPEVKRVLSTLTNNIMSMKPKFLAMAMMAAVSESEYNRKNSDLTPNDEVLNKTLPKKVIPKGCKEYWFRNYGIFSNEEPKPTIEIAYYCIAISDKKAIEKFIQPKNSL